MRAIRFVLTMAALSIAATPAAAQEAADADAPARQLPPAEEFAEQLRDPQLQATVTATVAILGEVMLDMPVGPLVQAMDHAVDRMAEETGTDAPERTDISPGATLRDMIGPGGDRMTTELAERVPQAMDAAAGMSGAVARIIPVLQDMAEKMKRALPARLPARLPTLRRD